MGTSQHDLLVHNVERFAQISDVRVFKLLTGSVASQCSTCMALPLPEVHRFAPLTTYITDVLATPQPGHRLPDLVTCIYPGFIDSIPWAVRICLLVPNPLPLFVRATRYPPNSQLRCVQLSPSMLIFFTVSGRRPSATGAYALLTTKME